MLPVRIVVILSRYGCNYLYWSAFFHLVILSSYSVVEANQGNRLHSLIPVTAQIGAEQASRHLSVRLESSLVLPINFQVTHSLGCAF